MRNALPAANSSWIVAPCMKVYKSNFHLALLVDSDSAVRSVLVPLLILFVLVIVTQLASNTFMMFGGIDLQIIFCPRVKFLQWIIKENN